MKGRLAAFHFADHSVVTYGYDQQGRKAKEVYAKGSINFGMAYSYDAIGKLKELTYPKGETYSYDYDPATGQLLGLSGIIADSWYEHLGRLFQRSCIKFVARKWRETDVISWSSRACGVLSIPGDNLPRFENTWLYKVVFILLIKIAKGLTQIVPTNSGEEPMNLS